MTEQSFLYLTEEDINNLDIQWEEIFEIVENAFIEKAKGTVENPPKLGVHSKETSFIHAMPAYLSEMGAIGIKWVAGYPSNREKGLPMISGLQIMNSVETGLPLAIMNATWLTNARTGAVSAVSAKRLAKKDSEKLGLIGAGMQGRYQIKALKKVIPSLKKIKVFDIFEEASQAFKKEIEKEVDDIEVEIVKTVKDAVIDSDIVITAVPRVEKPLVELDWLKPGVLCMPLESSRAWHNDALFGVDKFVNDDLDQAEMFKSQGAFPEGIPKLHAETGDIIANIKSARENDQERIMVMNIGLGCIDIAVGHYIYKKALNENVGKKLSL